jgi:hypothetical protein
VGIVMLSYLLGFRLGSGDWQAELTRVRLEAARAERQLHDLSRDALINMMESAERPKRPGPPPLNP